jgi:hypothetical protein
MELIAHYLNDNLAQHGTLDAVVSSLTPVANRIAGVRLLGSTEEIHWQAAPQGVVIQPAANWPCRHAVVFKMEMKK